jgi:hypothetical protein
MWRECDSGLVRLNNRREALMGLGLRGFEARARAAEGGKITFIRFSAL